MERYYNVVQHKTTGSVINGASVTVYEAASGSVATIYKTDGLTALSQPFLSGYSRSEGEIEFAAANGQYNIKIVNGAETDWIYGISLIGIDDEKTVKDTLRLQVGGLTELRGLTPVDGEILYLKYHTTQGDGGHGVFEALTGAAAGTYTDDNGVTIVPTGGDGSSCWRRVLTDHVSVDMYGTDLTGATNVGTKIQAARDAAASLGLGLVFNPSGTYLCTDFVISETGSVPAYVNGNGCALIADTGTTTLLTVENPQSVVPTFWLRGFYLDADDVATNGLYIHGLSRSEVSDVWVENSTGDGVVFEAEAGYGIYYSTFKNLTSRNNGGDGFSCKTIDASYRLAANTMTDWVSQFNIGAGFDFDYFQNVCVGFVAEVNNAHAFVFGYSRDITLLGGYSENNHQDEAGGGVGDGSDDYSFYMTANSLGIKVVGGRHIGSIDPASTKNGNGNYFYPTNSYPMEVYQDVIVGDTTNIRGITLSGALKGAINGTTASITASGGTATITARASLGANGLWLMSASFQGVAVFSSAIIRAPGVSGTAAVFEFADGGATTNLVISESAGNIIVTNNTGSDRICDYSLVRLQ